jgi:hypothetical protein
MSLLAALFIQFAGFAFLGFKAMGAPIGNQTISARFNLDDLLDGSVAPRGRSNLVSIELDQLR